MRSFARLFGLGADRFTKAISTTYTRYTEPPPPPPPPVATEPMVTYTRDTSASDAYVKPTYSDLAPAIETTKYETATKYETLHTEPIYQPPLFTEPVKYPDLFQSLMTEPAPVPPPEPLPIPPPPPVLFEVQAPPAPIPVAPPMPPAPYVEPSIVQQPTAGVQPEVVQPLTPPPSFALTKPQKWAVGIGVLLAVSGAAYAAKRRRAR